MIDLDTAVRERFVRGRKRECWPWLGEVHKASGYGYFRKMRAHVLVYEMIIGPVPEGLVIDHLCRRRDCVNPFHMEPVTRGENVLRGNCPNIVIARTGICSRGHKIEGDNAVWRTLRSRDGTPRRSATCRTCFRNRQRSYYVKKESV